MRKYNRPYLLPCRNFNVPNNSMLCRYPGGNPDFFVIFRCFPAKIDKIGPLHRKCRQYVLRMHIINTHHIFFQPAFQTTFFFQNPGSWTCWIWTWWCSWWSSWWNKFPKRSRRCCATALLDACDASAVWSSNLTAFVDTCDLWSNTPRNI